MNSTLLKREISRQDQLDLILDLSLAMLDSARSGDWEGLQAREQERRVLVTECFRVAASSAEAPQVAEALRRILVVNDELASLTRAQRDVLGASLQGFGTARKAQKAYGQHL
ncbi:MAG: flagellar protein FliT [Gammaproteobacteria bacterium]|nr:flagellar protein FliT [Gammaproteobacteria bacterium]